MLAIILSLFNIITEKFNFLPGSLRTGAAESPSN
jgi:hypothetical protein